MHYIIYPSKNRNRNGLTMPAEKIYYAAIILLSAVSVLLSPFFYVRRGRNGLKAVTA